MRLTKTSLTLLAIISLLILAERFLPNWVSHMWPIITAGWLFLLLSERVILLFQKINIHRQMEKQFYLGSSARVTYSITNRNKYPVRLWTEETPVDQLLSNKHTHEWNLSAGQQQQQYMSIKPVALGNTSFTQIKATVLGRLALAWWTRYIKLPQTVEIQPECRTTCKPDKLAHNDFSQQIDLPAYSSITLVVNTSRLNQLVSGDLRRVDHYINACIKLASRALAAHRTVHFIVYDDQVRLLTHGIKHIQQLNNVFASLPQATTTMTDADHRCVLPHLGKIHQPGLLLWYTDLDDVQNTIELEKIIQPLKQRFKVLVYNLLTSEKNLMGEELVNHCRSPYHKLEILKQQQWRASQQILQRAGIASIAS